MDHAGAVRFVERIGDVDADRQHLLERERPFRVGQPISQRLAIEILHDEVVDLLVTADVVDGADVWMRQRGNRPRLAFESRAAVRIGRQVHGELLKLGIDVCQATVAKYMERRRQPPSQTWRTFLRNHIGQVVAADFFVVPTATCRLLFVLVLLAHDRRRIRHVAVTAHPTAAWTAQQLREAFPWDQAPRYLLHDRDHAFDRLEATAKAMGIEEVLTAPRAPWQNAFVERFIGSARRECLDHVIVFNEAGLRKLMTLYCSYHERSRTHLSLDKDTPIPRQVTPPGDGDIVVIPEVGGLHHRYERRAA